MTRGEKLYIRGFIESVSESESVLDRRDTLSLDLECIVRPTKNQKIRWHKSRLMDDKCRNISQVSFADRFGALKKLFSFDSI